MSGLLALLGLCLVVTGALAEGDVAKDSQEKLTALEAEVRVLQKAVQELLQRTDLTLVPEETVEKRKNEFIRFGKRSDGFDKRKNEFIRFGKRKNEFIRFGRSDPELADESYVDKRKNEFIRFG